MENKLKEEIEKEVEELWNKELKENYDKFIESCLMSTLKDIKIQLTNYDNSVKSYIKNLEKEFDKKFNQQISQLQQQSINVKIKNEKAQVNNEFVIFNNNENNINEVLRKKDIDINLVSKPSLIILKSPQNSNELITLILNCLVNTKTLISYYLNRSKEGKIMQKAPGQPNKLGPAFLTLLDNFWKNNIPSYTPVEIHDTLKEIMKNEYYSQNPGLIFEKILSLLHNELNQNPLILNQNQNKENDPYDIFNRELILKKFNEIYQHTPTKISNSFYNIIETVTKCTNCICPQYSFKNIPIINIYLQANKDNAMFNDISFLEHFQSLLTDKNEEIINEYCLVCTNKENKSSFKHILDVTKIIIININRNNDPENIVEFKYPENFEKKDIINPDEVTKFENNKYELFCVMKKYEINNNAQFILYCKNFVNGAWYSFDNKEIKETNLIQVTQDYKHACLIIYQSKN